MITIYCKHTFTSSSHTVNRMCFRKARTAFPYLSGLLVVLPPIWSLMEHCDNTSYCCIKMGLLIVLYTDWVSFFSPDWWQLLLCTPQGLPWEPTLGRKCNTERLRKGHSWCPETATSGDQGQAQKRTQLEPVGIGVDATAGSITPLLTPRT